MTRDVPGGREEQTTWLPAVYAQEGYELRLRGVPGWRVKEVGVLSTLGRIEAVRRADIRAAGRGRKAWLHLPDWI